MICGQHSRLVLILIGSAGVAGAAAESTPAATIPLCPGLTIVTAVAQPSGDYESIKTIEAAGPKEVRLKYSSEANNTGLLDSGPPVKQLTLHRSILAGDLETANFYQQTFMDKSAETIPGTTSIGTSAAVLKALKTKGEAEMSISNAYSGLELSADRKKFPSYYDYMQTGKIRKIGLARVSVLVNDKLVDLPAIHAQGEFVGDKAEFFFLDDERNPLTLAFRLGIGSIKPLIPETIKLCETFRKAGASVSLGLLHCDMPNGGDRDTLRVIKITYRCATAPLSSTDGTGTGQLPGSGGLPSGEGAAGGADALEHALASTGKVDVYSIYFSFNSDTIREESEPTLKEIAEVLRRHPDWKLRVGGHTDGIGGDKYNLDLSSRRAAGVKDALVKRYKVATGRLGTAGFGKSQPKDTNDTIEGRARNRRVELVRQS
jgi:outer membrane protein OmpA-like peptidoglycan-associated protein